jgi:hypothetical protein
MLLMIFLAAVAVSIVLERQEKRHLSELSRAFDNAALDMPPLRPRITRFEAWTNISLGVLLLGAGGAYAWAVFRLPMGEAMSPAISFLSLLLAAGAALVVLGLRVLKLWQHSSAEEASSKGV